MSNFKTWNCNLQIQVLNCRSISFNFREWKFKNGIVFKYASLLNYLTDITWAQNVFHRYLSINSRLIQGYPQSIRHQWRLCSLFTYIHDSIINFLSLQNHWILHLRIDQIQITCSFVRIFGYSKIKIMLFWKTVLVLTGQTPMGQLVCTVTLCTKFRTIEHKQTYHTSLYRK